ncbi:GNAT family N-acetyltransferase [Flavobacteriales bacterium 34_180_T64]|nr:GNAT family N-acetyltransferase [Flavobacteriales bacterium 34_180_T64]
MYHTRIATLNDLPILLQFEQRLIEAERPMDPTLKEEKISYYDLSEFIKNENSELYVVEIHGEIVASGYAKIKTDRPYLKHDKQGYLGFMFVSEEHRGKGLNKQITNALLNWCKSKGVFEIKLDVYENNPSAIKAYEKVGFKKHLINMRLNIKDLDFD